MTFRLSLRKIKHFQLIKLLVYLLIQLFLNHFSTCLLLLLVDKLIRPVDALPPPFLQAILLLATGMTVMYVGITQPKSANSTQSKQNYIFHRSKPRELGLL